MKQEYDFSGAKRGVFRRASGPFELPASTTKPWQGPEGSLGRFVRDEARKTLEAYRVQPHLVTEHANQEYDTAHGGYAHRQLFELVQNGADALTPEGTGRSILVRLTERFLYCADDGKPIDEEGVRGLMFAHMSSKRGTTEIGRFGMGFKSVLGVTCAPEFYSRSGSLRFNRARASELIREHVPAARYPTLRLPEPMDGETEAASDDDLRELMSWAALLDGLSEPGRFWAFFPTQTSSLLAGILNAPWKTNEDRQNLLPCTYNDELIDAAARMVADALPSLGMANDSARHLRALLREEDGDSTHGIRLRKCLIASIDGRRDASARSASS